jgi:hypothetical protein
VDEASRLTSALILGQLLMSSFARISDTREEKRRPFFVYIDEAQAVATRDLAIWLHESCKAAISLCLASQSLSEYTDELTRSAVLTAGTLVVFRVSGAEDAKTLAPSFDRKPEPPEIRAPVADVVAHLLRHGHSHEAVSRFTRSLMALQALIRQVAAYPYEVVLGRAALHLSHLLDGQRYVNDVLVEAMRSGRSQICIPPLAILVLGGATDRSCVEVLSSHMKSRAFNHYVLEGFTQSAVTFGQPGFRSEEGLDRFLAGYTRPGFFRRLLGLPRQAPPYVTAFIRFLRNFREVLEILAKQPLTVATGESPTEFRPRSFADAENQIANEISQLDRFTARVRTFTGEYVIKTRPAPRGITGPALTVRLHAIQERMVDEGLLRPVQDVMKEVAERHERLRAPASRRSGGGRMLRTSEPTPQD